MKKWIIYTLFAINLMAVVLLALWTYGWIGDHEKEEIQSRGTPPQVVDIGSGPNTGTGDPLRTAFNKININFSAVYDSLEKWTDLIGPGGSMTWPASAGIAVYTGSQSWGTSITDNSTNWNTAYGWGDHSLENYINSITATSIAEGVLEDALEDAPIGVAVEDVVGGTTGRNRYMSPAQIENYVALHGGGGGSFSGGERIKFTIGDLGAPAVNDNSFSHSALTGKQIDLFRNRMLSPYTYSSGSITVDPDWEADENVELWLWPANTWEYLSLAPSILDDLVVYLKLDETSGAIGVDEVGNQDANVYGTDPWVTGKINNGVEISSSEHLVRTPFNDDINLKNVDFSVSMWVYFNSIPSEANKTGYLFNFRDAGTVENVVCAYIANTGNQADKISFSIRNQDDDHKQARSATLVSADQWYHIVCVSSASEDMKVYINGVDDTAEDTQVRFTDRFDQPDSYIQFGNRIRYSSEYIRAVIDEPMIYHRALSAGDVEYLWNDGDGRQLIIP